MTQYGSLFNSLYASSKTPEPEVGMGATELLWSDRHAHTIVEVVNSRTIITQQDKATRTDDFGMSDSQSYSYKPDTTSPRRTWTKRKNGSWVAKGQPMKGGVGLAIGFRSEYYDFSF